MLWNEYCNCYRNNIFSVTFLRKDASHIDQLDFSKTEKVLSISMQSDFTAIISCQSLMHSKFFRSNLGDKFRESTVKI